MRRLSTLLVLILLFPLIFLLTGCPGTVSTPSTPSTMVIPLINDIDCHIDEGYYYRYGNPITIDKPGRIDVYFNLKEWDEDYRLEIFFLTVENFLHFKDDEAFSAIANRAILHTGVYEFGFNISPGSYYLIVDNSNLGWDDAVYDLVATYTTTSSY